MRPLIPLVCALLTTIIFGCQEGGPATPQAATPAATSPPDLSAVQFTPLRSESGVVEGPIGVWWLSHDGDTATLAPLRTATAQGDEFALPINAFLEPGSLKLISSTPVPGGVDYQVSFTHPFPMPADLARPATAQKRTDLFLTDVHLVILADGATEFFDGAITLNQTVVQNADGYRQVSPMLDPADFGITQANTFPYRVLSAYDPLDANGNYSATDAWTEGNLLNARGYDVVPQGATVETIVRGPATVPAGLAVVLMARYMDPRAGATVDERIANRLPDPSNPAAQRYYLPEACGDIQVIELTVEGELVEGSDVESANLRARVRDWDHASTIATSFPDPTNPTHIRRSSNPFNIAADIPSLKDTPYTGNQTGPSTGQVLEWTNKYMAVRNTALTFAPPPGETAQLPGLLRIEDSQDFGAIITLLDAELTPLPGEGLRPSTRYQTFTMPVRSSSIPPVITGAFPNGGMPGQQVTFGITTSGGSPTVWTWNFGGGATPNTASVAAPTVLLSAAGTYNATVRAGNAYGLSDPFPFEITIGLIPQITGVTPPALADYSGETASFTVQTTGAAPTGWSWNFGGGATPATSSAPAPLLTLTALGTHTGSIQVTNTFGSSAPFEFDYTVFAAVPPSVIEVQPTGVVGLAGAPVIFSATTAGRVEGYAWNFGGGTTPNSSTDPTPNVTLGAAGIYNGSLIVSNVYGASAAFPFAYSISAGPVPVILSVNPNGPVGMPAEVVQFNLTATQNPTIFSWNFGGGATPNTSTVAFPEVTLGSVGGYIGTVTASNVNGTSAPFEFNYTIAIPGPGWGEIISGGDAQLIPYRATFDDLGNTYVVGTFTTAVDFDPGSGEFLLNTLTGRKGFLLKLNAGGALVFARAWGAMTGNHQVYADLDYDPATDRLHCLGYWTDTSDFDPGPGELLLAPVDASGYSAFWVELTSAGDFVDIHTFGGETGDANPWALEIHPSGDFLLTGRFSETVDMDPSAGVETRTGDASDPFLLRVSPTGVLDWAFTESITNSNNGHVMVCDPSGNIYWPRESQTEYALHSFTADGALRWKNALAASDLRISTMAMLPSGDLRAVGELNGTVDLDPGPGTANLSANDDAFFWDFTTDNLFIRKGVFGSSSPVSSPVQMVLDAEGYSYILSEIRAATTLDRDPGPDTSNYDFSGFGGYVIRLTPDGVYDGFFPFEGDMPGYGIESLGLTGDRDLIVVGTFMGTIDLDPSAGVNDKTSVGTRDALYFARFATQ